MSHSPASPLPLRYASLALCVLGLLASLAWWAATRTTGALAALLACALLCAVGLRDLRQRSRAILRNYPVIGHLRFLLEYIRPELRQYFLESDTEAAPFSRAQRSLVYQRAKGEPDNRPFGTQLDVTRQGYEWINHSMQPTV
ncbi:MAG TPA: FMN-binding glutamate synthase family protein, partial [Ramlibacter sp.]|nr:FMN-binding glutamate synthase family protein [Ramlibacter sp.]